MIARIWRSTTTLVNADRYQEYLNRFVIPRYQTAEGNRGLYIMKECKGGLVHFLLLSLWTSTEALTKHIGTPGDVVHPAPDEQDMLIAFESTARHYNVLEMPG